jgi:MFS family permease
VNKQLQTSVNPGRKAALRFVLTIGIVSLFADLTYEGARSITGPLLATLGATGAVVGFVAGLGELLGYGLRLVSGKISDRTKEFWPITLIGYFVQMAAVPLLALAGNWKSAAALILLERIGKAIRNPPRDVMLSHAAKDIGYGWAFGVHEALDQFGALLGPLVVAGVIAKRGQYQTAFAVLAVPATITLAFLLLARWVYPRPEEFEPAGGKHLGIGHSSIFWMYLAGAALVAAGFADFQLIAFHFQRADAVSATWIPIAYSIAMAVSGAGSLLFGKLFDRVGLFVLIPLTAISAAFAPLVFLGGFWGVIVGSALWGLGMGVHESIIPAAVATMVPPDRRASAYGVFTGTYGVAWFIGSAIMGWLYDRSLGAVVIFCVMLQLISIPFFYQVWDMRRHEHERIGM